MSTTQRYAILESNTGYVWWVGEAESPLAACYAMSAEVGSQDRDDEDGAYEEAADRRAGDVLDVRLAPAGFDVRDGQDEDAIADVQALEPAGVFQWVRRPQRGRPKKAPEDRVHTPVRTLRLSDEHWGELQSRGGVEALRDWLATPQP